MTKKNWIFFFVISLLCMGQIIPPERKSKYTINYPHEVGVYNEGFGLSYTGVIISTNAPEDIVIDDINVNRKNFCVEYNNIAISKDDQLHLSKKKAVKLIIYYFGKELIKTPCFLEFSSNNPDFLKNRVRIHTNTFDITSEAMQKGKVELDISKSSADSVLIRFPYGGTINSATVWKNTERNRDNVVAQLNGYEIGSDNNYLIWSKKNLGVFSVNFGSCHWFADFELILK